MKKGFTLVELLAVIVILGVISLITVVSVNSLLSDSKSSLSDVQKHNIEEAAKTYYLKEGMAENVLCININDLISKGYIDAKEVKDPKTKEDLQGSVKIHNLNNQYSYEYNSKNCPICELTDKNSNNAADPGEIIICDTEEFFVLPQDTENHPVDNNTISLLGKEIEDDCVFSESTYWLDASGNLLDEYSNGFVYNKNSNLYSIIETYKTKLEKKGVDIVEATLPTLYQMNQLGCDENGCPTDNSADLANWISNVFWLGNVYEEDYEILYLTDVDYSVALITGPYYDNFSGSGSHMNGVNPVIIIEKSELK